MMMQLLIDRTTESAALGGVECRKWRGFGPDGGAFDVWVYMVAPLDDRALAYAEDHLRPVEPQPAFEPRAIEMSRGDVSAVVAQAVEEVRGITRDNRTQAALDRLIESAHADGEDVLAFALLLVQAARCAGEEDIAAAVTALSGVIADREKERPGREGPAGPSATAIDAASESVAD